MKEESNILYMVNLLGLSVIRQLKKSVIVLISLISFTLLSAVVYADFENPSVLGERGVAQNTGIFQWAKRFGGIGEDEGHAVAIDSSGNIAVTGYIWGSADLNGDGDATDGRAESAVGYGGYDVSLTIFDSSGADKWTKRLGGIATDYGNAVAFDSSGNVVVTGFVYGSADLNGDGDRDDGGAEGAIGYLDHDVFISVFTSSGIPLWSKRLGGTGSDRGQGVAIDSADNIIVTGYVSGAADLNGDGDATDDGAESAVGYGGFDPFITVFDSSGNHLWAKRLGGISTDIAFSVTTDFSDNIVVTVYVTGDADLNGDGDSTDGGAENGTGYLDTDIFVSTFLYDTIPPTGEVEIRSERERVMSRDVDLYISGIDGETGVEEMMVCNDRLFTGCTWEEYQSGRAWTLTEGDGEKRVYVKFKDRAGNESSVYSDSIELDTISPGMSIRDIDGYPLETEVRWLVNGRPFFEGRTEPNTVVRVEVGSAGISDWLTSDSGGYWSWQPSYSLSLGIHEVGHTRGSSEGV